MITRYSGTAEVSIAKKTRTKSAQKYAVYVRQGHWDATLETSVPLGLVTNTPKFYDEVARDVLEALAKGADTPIEVEGLERTRRTIHIRRTP